MYLTQVANAPISTRVPDPPSLTIDPIEWAPLADLSVPSAVSKIVYTPTNSPFDDFIVVVRPPPAVEAPPARAVADNADFEAPTDSKGIDVQPAVPFAPLVVILQPWAPEYPFLFQVLSSRFLCLMSQRLGQ